MPSSDKLDTPSETHLAQLPHWTLVDDVRGGTEAIRAKKSTYLPKFDAESQTEWNARVAMTFVDDDYQQALADLVGLVFSAPPTLADDVPLEIKTQWENIDGAGTHWEVFAQEALTTALHLGFSVLYTDYPKVAESTTLDTARALQQRPYATLYRADDVLSADHDVVGGVLVMTMITLRETYMSIDGVRLNQLRILRQEIKRRADGDPIGLGAISFEIHRQISASNHDYTLADEGFLDGPDRIPVRIVYGGEKRAALNAVPHLLGLAYLTIENTQVSSDYAVIMHKCNVPTPVFKGRKVTGKVGDAIRLGTAGIDLNADGDAKFLEPSGAALGATRSRLTDISTKMARKGAHILEPTSAMTATQAALYARQRNARVLKAARSLQDALEGVLQDFNSFNTGAESDSAGQITFNLDFASASSDPAFAKLALDAYSAGVLPMWAVLEVMKSGKLPDDFDAERIALDQLAGKESELAAREARLTESVVGAVREAQGQPPDGFDLVKDANGATTGVRASRPALVG